MIKRLLSIFAPHEPVGVMSQQDADDIMSDYSAALEKQWLVNPSALSPRLQRTSRAQLRKAILLWVANRKFEGMNILERHNVGQKQPVAVLETAQNIWMMTPAFGPRIGGRIDFEASAETAAAAGNHDTFVQLLSKLDPKDPTYWKKVYEELKCFDN